MATNFSVQISDTQSGTYVDITPYIALGGLKISRQDIDASGSGRDTQDGLLHRHRVAIKTRLDVTCKPLTAAQAQTVLTAILPEWVWVKYFDLQTGATATKKMYSNNIPATALFTNGSVDYWTGITFPLIEQ